ncbi:MAG: hypothetical protein AB1798_04880 [Spirochaetota bacterium]
MKTAISLPERIFKQAERYARKLKKSRSQLYVEAITEYLERHAPDTITEEMNQVCNKLGDQDTAFTTKASRDIIASEPW